MLFDYYSIYWRGLQGVGWIICIEAKINGEAIVYHPQLVAVYHQHEVLYIIKPQRNTAFG